MTTTEISSERLDSLIKGLEMWVATDRSAAPDLDRDIVSALTELRDRRAAGGEAVAITPHMLNAGTNEITVPTMDADEKKDLAVKVFRAMTDARSSLHPSNSGVGVKALDWVDSKALIGRKLIAHDLFGNEFARLDYDANDMAETDQIAAFKREAEARYQGVIFSALHPSPDTGKSQDQEGTWSDGGKEWTPAPEVNRLPEWPFGHDPIVITDEMVERLKRAYIAETRSMSWPTDGEFRTMLTAALSTKKDV